MATIAGTDRINDSIAQYIRYHAIKIADSLDNVNLEKRTPIDSAILAKLDRIGTDIKRTTYFQEQSMTDKDYSRAQALWVRDSIRWAKER